MPKDITDRDSYYEASIHGKILTRAIVKDGNVWRAKLVSFSAGAEMNKQASWVRANIAKDTGENSLYLLKHETGHDRIAKQGSRLLNDALSGLSASGSTQSAASDALNSKFIETVVEWGERIKFANDKYDSDTNHGTNTPIQDAYNKQWGF